MLNEICLFCFAVNRRSYNIINTHLQPVLERFTNSKIENVSSYLLCFICHTRLQQAYELLQLAEEADCLLQTYLVDKTNEKFPLKKSLVDLSVSHVSSISIIPNGMRDFKEEPELNKDPTVEIEDQAGEIRVIYDIECPSNVNTKCEDDPLKVISTKEYMPDIEGDIKMEIEIEDCKGIEQNHGSDDLEDFGAMEDTSVHLDTNSEKFNRDSKCVKDLQNSVSKEKTLNENKGRSKLFKCDTCGGEFNNKDSMKNHMLVAHLSKSFYCRVCGRPYRHRYLLIRHERSHTRHKPYRCEVCNRDFVSPSSLKTHMVTHTGDKPFSCHICQRSFSQKGSVKAHMRSHTGEKPYSCDHCEKKFSFTSTLNAHIRTHTGERPFVCDICNRNFSQPHVLKEHRRIHTDKKRRTLKTHEISRTHLNMKPEFKTDHSHEIGIEHNHGTDELQDFNSVVDNSSVPLITNSEDLIRDSNCAKNLQNSESKEKSLNENKERSKLSLKCDTCGGEFNDKDSLKKHMLVAHLSESFCCRVCGRPYRHRYLLIRHERSHTSHKPYSCEICKRGFVQRSSLKTHMVTHMDDKPFRCNICQRSFTQKGALKAHMRTHTGEKPYSCDYCEKKFSHISSLDAHIRTHTGERPFICDICDRNFSQRHSLREHRRIHTGEKPYACDICHLRYPNRRALKTHERSHTE